MIQKRALFLILVFLLGCEGNEETRVLSPLEQAQKDLQVSPSFESHINLGMAFSNAGDHVRALQTYLKAREMSPKSPLAWNNVCAELNAAGRHFEALESCKKAVELEPGFALAKQNLALTESGLESYRAEVLKQTRALKETPELFSSAQVFQLANGLFQMQKFDEAMKLWSRIKSSDADFANAQFNISTTWILLKNHSKALSHLETALKAEPENLLFKNNLTWLQNQINKPSKSPASE